MSDIQATRPAARRSAAREAVSVRKNGNGNGNGAKSARRPSAAANIVMRAASILEEEIAVGIEAAQEIESRYIDVAKLRNGDPDHVMARLRKDAHDIVDIAVDLVHAAAIALDRALTLEAGRALPPGNNGSRPMPAIEIPEIKPGESGEVTFTLSNSDDTATPTFTFQTLGLISSKGTEIPATAVSLTPENIVIPPRGSIPLKVSIRVPPGTPPGHYTGLLQSSHLDGLCAKLGVTVVG